jgi:exodeoxyribonuclease-3
MIIATWNVNSIRARQQRVLAWLQSQRPDVLCLQELKVTDEEFPREPFQQIGYQAAVFGQKTYNGVAILALSRPQDVERGFNDEVEDAQARFIAATVDGVRILSAYAPNGEETGSEKYAYKQNWFYRLRTHLKDRKLLTGPVALCGDLNIAPEERDVADPDKWEWSVLFNADMRAEFRDLLSLGLVDAFRLHHRESGCYSWWDYRDLGFPRNDGLRIDHILVSEALRRRCADAHIDREARQGEKPSDHAPVLAVFD